LDEVEPIIMPANTFWPFSGDVTQAWATMLRSMSQVGLVNVINETKSGDPELERKIVTEGFSYGSQLGRIIDAVDVLVRQAKEPGAKTKADEKAFEDFSEMATKVAGIKSGLPLSDTDLDEFVRRMEAHKQENPQAYEKVRQQIDRLQDRLK
jgi:hypothetical protein